MTGYEKSPLEFSVEELDKELVARGGQVSDEERFKFKDREGTPERDAVMTGAKELYRTPPSSNEDLAHIGTWDLAKILIFKTRSTMDFTRGSWSDDLKDFYEITGEPIDKNAQCVAAIVTKNDLIQNEKDLSTLKVKNYGKAFNLCDFEPFRDQPVAAGRMCTGFLVKEDIIATAAHCVNEKNVADLRILFGYKMVDSTTPVIRFSNDHIYHGLKIIHRVHNPRGNGPDWALVKLDRSVGGQTVARLSKDKISLDQAVYVIGYPLGLPMKYAAGSSVADHILETYFKANLNVYSGTSGSPVFDLHTHEVIGMVAGGENRDFRWTGKGWMSVQYPEGKRVGCTRVSELMAVVREL